MRDSTETEEAEAQLTRFEPVVLLVAQARHDAVHVLMLLLLLLRQLVHQILAALSLLLPFALRLHKQHRTSAQSLEIPFEPTLHVK